MESTNRSRIIDMVETTQIRKWYEAELRKVKRWHSLSSFSLVPGLSCVGGA